MFASMSVYGVDFRPTVVEHDDDDGPFHVIRFGAGSGDPSVGLTLPELERLHAAIGEHLLTVYGARADRGGTS